MLSINRSFARSSPRRAAPLVLAILLAALLSGLSRAAEPTAPPLLPTPKSFTPGKGSLVLTSESRIVASTPDLKPLARVLSDEIQMASGLRLAVPERPDSRPGDIVLLVNRDVIAGSGILAARGGSITRSLEGAHRITVGNQALVEGFDFRAVAEGTATLLQSLHVESDEVSLPRMRVHDWPHADYIAAMVDVARQQVTADDLRACVQACRLYKVRYLHLHLTDDQAWTFPSTAFPKLGATNAAAHGGVPPRRYTLRELNSLVRFANERGVTLVPEIEMPGHSGAARGAMPELFSCVDSATGEVRDVGMMDIASPRLLAALDTLIGEVADVFRSSPYIHIGGDELSGLPALEARPETKAYMLAHGLKDSGELLNHFMRQVSRMVNKRGKKALIWEGGASEASPDIIVVCWDGDAKTAERLIAKGFTTITCPWNLGVPWPEWNMYVCNGSTLKIGDSVLGSMTPIWERGGEVSLQMLRDGVPKRQERTWGPENTFTPESIAPRLAANDLLLDRLWHGFQIRHDRPIEITGLQERTCSITTPIKLSLHTAVSPARITFTRDGSEPNANSPLYEGEITIDDNVLLRARLFDARRTPLARPWRLQYEFHPLSAQPVGLLADADGKESPWFAESIRVQLASTLRDGTIRYTLDGTPPLPTSDAYTAALELDKTTQLRAAWFDASGKRRGSILSADYSKLPAAIHAAIGKSIAVQSPEVARGENNKLAALLVDGRLTRDNWWHTPEVLRCDDKDLDAVIDLGQPVEIRKVGIHFMHCQESGIFPAVLVTFSASDDGDTFRPLAEIKYAVPENPESRGSFAQLLQADVKNATARYVRVVAKNLGVIPDWHPVKGVPCHMMLDEILINGE